MCKKLFLLMSLAFVMGVLSNNVLAADPNLLAQYTFDSSDASDATGNGYNGTISAAGTTLVSDPIMGMVMNFDTGSIALPASLFTTISDTITISLWQNGNAALQPVNNSIFNGDAGTTNRILNSHLPYGTGAVFFDAGLSGTAYDRINRPATADQYEGQWNYWAFTKDSVLGQMKIYINGKLFQSGSGKTKSMSGVTRFNIGAASDGLTNFYKGMVDDFRIYNRVLAQKEMLELAGVNTAQGQSPDGGTNLSVAQTLSWTSAHEESRTFNVYYGKDANSVRDSQPGALLGGTVLEQVAVTSLAHTFDAASTYYWRVDVVDGGTVYADEKIHTFNIASANSYNFLPANAQSGLNPARTVLSWSAGSLAVTGYNVYLGTNQTAVTNGTGGTKVATLQTSISYTPTLTANTTYFWRIEDVGTSTVSSAVMSFATGTAIDPSLVAWWNFEGVTGTSVPDASGSGHTGTMVGNSTIVTDAVRGNVLSLDGTGDYIVVTGYKGIAGASPRTICAWIKTSKTGANYQGILAWGQNTSGKSWDFVVYDSKIRQMAYNNNATGAINVADGNWHHVASVLGGSTLNTVKIYVDGVADTVTSTTVAVSTGSTRDVRIGDTDSLGSRQFNGMLADVRLYNRALSAQEIDDMLPKNYTIIDNMEDYNDVTKPIDGPGGWRDNDFNHDPGGHTYIGRIANLDPVKSGEQSLKLTYDDFDWNHWVYYNSETVKIFDVPQDWSYATSEKKVKMLTIPVRGLATNGADKLYTALEDEVGHSFTIYHSDPNILTKDTWQIWTIPLANFTGVNLAKVKKIFLGVGNRNETNPPASWLAGTVYFDNLSVNPPSCRPDMAKPAGDLTNDCLVSLADVKIMANNWLAHDVTVVPETVSDSNLESRWTFDNSNATDSSGKAHDCVTVGAVNYVYDANRGSTVLSLDGVAGNYLNAGGGNGGWATFTKSMTYCAWFKVDQFNLNMQCLIGTSGSYRLSRNGTTNSMRLWHDLGARGTLAGTSNVNDGKWHHGCGVVDSDGINMTAYLYIDGKLENSKTYTGILVPLASDLIIGADGIAYPGREWNGCADDVRMYSRALSHGEVLTLAGITQPIVIPVEPTVNLKVKGTLGQEVIDYRDYSVIADNWLKVVLWP